MLVSPLHALLFAVVAFAIAVLSNCHRQVLSSCMMNFGEQELCGGAQVTTQARIEIRNQYS